MSKMNQKFIEEYDNVIDDFCDDEYHYKLWLSKIDSITNKPTKEEK